ncbi:MAG: hypothetical protein KIC94_06150 [Clostridiales bacterium]|nr:hypothetical protein [Clostridiales bacterium]
MHKKRKFLEGDEKVIAKRRKFIITGVVILAMIAVICIVIAYSNSDETDYVFEGTFVTEESIEVVDTARTILGEQGDTDEMDKDSFKRKSGDCVFV